MNKLFSKLAKLILNAVSVVVLFACKNIDTPLPSNSWENHQALISDFTQWHLQGRLNIRTETESNSVNINWRQEQDTYTINLSKLGLGGVKIEGNKDTVKLEKSGEQPVYTDTLDTLSRDYLDYEFPAGLLFYWIRGIPAPELDTNFDLQLNEKQLLETLHQDQWLLEFDDYEVQSNGLVLPGRIKLEQAFYRLTFNIDRW